MVPATKPVQCSQQVVLAENSLRSAGSWGLSIDVKPTCIGAKFDAGMIIVSDLTRAAGQLLPHC
jgi:hypothetical protein